MSDTRRWTQPGWDGISGLGKKHQQRDRTQGRRTIKHTWRFTNCIKNCLYNLTRKVEQLRDREARSD